MILIKRNNTNPYFNIAAEEHFLKNYSEDILMFWQSSPSVVVGKHQNTMSEVNINFAHKNNIPVIRRISGGGTVYHDEGNINYSIITSSDNTEKLVDFRKFTEPIIGFLDSLGLVAVFEGKNNLTINDKKISGNSAHVFKNRVLHHGTLLFNTNLDTLVTSISQSDFSITDKSVKSIRANVVNIADHLPQHISTEEFMQKMIIYFCNYYNIDSTVGLSDNDTTSIEELVKNKYKLWDWNYGYSPAYNYKHELNGIKLNMRINKGIIENIDIGGRISFKEEICNELLNVKYEKEAVEEVFTSYQISMDDLNLFMMLFGFY